MLLLQCDSFTLNHISTFLDFNGKQNLCVSSKILLENCYLIIRNLRYNLSYLPNMDIKSQINLVRHVFIDKKINIDPIIASNITSIQIDCYSMTEPTLIWLYRTFRNIVNIKCIRCIEVSYLGNVGKIILREEKSDFRDGCLYLGNVNEMIFQEMEKSNFRNVKFSNKSLIQLHCLPKLKECNCDKLKNFKLNIMELLD